MIEFIKDLCEWKNSISPSDVISIIISIITLIATVYIPEKIKWEQTYSALIMQYISYDFARALQGIVEFFNKECNQDVSLIKEKYEIHFQKEMNDNTRASDTILHFQRRLLAQFYTQLDLCAQTPAYYIGKKRVQKDFTINEANVVRVLFFMGKAVEDSEILYKDISCDIKVPHCSRVRGQNKYLSHIYEVLKSGKKYID